MFAFNGLERSKAIRYISSQEAMFIYIDARVTFIYGSDETLYACAPSFEAAMKKYNVDYRMIVGEGMFHCYPVFPIVKEAREGWDMMVQLMKA